MMLLIGAGAEGLQQFRVFPWQGINVMGAARPTASAQTFINTNFRRQVAFDTHTSLAGARLDPIEDFQPPTFGHFARFMTDANTAAASGENLFAHCGFGGGRTGTMLASLLIAKDALSADAVAPMVGADGMATILSSGSRVGATFVPDSVERVIASLRKIDIEGSSPNPVSVETKEQIQTLIVYDALVRLAVARRSGNGRELAAQLQLDSVPMVVRTKFLGGVSVESAVAGLAANLPRN